MVTRRSPGREWLRAWSLLVACAAAAAMLITSPAAATVPSGFTDSIAFGGLTAPTTVRFAPNGQVFVAEQSGLIKVFDGLSDTTPTTYADLRAQVHNYWDRGLLGLAIDPGYPTRPYVYVLYTYDHVLGDAAPPPKWGDGCPTPPGPTTDGCVVSGRLSRLGGGGEQVLLEDWCQQYPSHSVGDLRFGTDGALYVSAGEGASFTFADYGQRGNPCGDPANEGGALRSQDVRSLGDPTGLGGSVLRVDPNTGAALFTNPLAGSGDPNAARIVATGLRNPFRFTLRPGTNEVWIGDVGWNDWEEINRVVSPTGSLSNFGWPCYEGNGRQAGYDALDVSLCENLYAQSSQVTAPYYAYNHSAQIVAGESCGTGSSSITGLAFYNGGTFPSSYNNALFFADFSRGCVWVMFAGANGLPDASTRQNFVTAAGGPVDLEVGPGGDLFYVDLTGGVIHRIHAVAANRQPTAVASASPTGGPPPLTVNFDASGSSDPDGDTLTYAWDLDDDGQFDDSTAAKPSFTYDSAGPHVARVRVSDPSGLSDTAAVTVVVGTPPTVTISTPAIGTTWQVGQSIAFSGSARDGSGAAMPASALTWDLDLQHCPNGSVCHTHNLQSFAGVASGSFVAPDHDYPSYLDLRLTATDPSGLSASSVLRLDPRIVGVTIASDPTGLNAVLGSEQAGTPFTRDAIVGSVHSISAPSPQTPGATTYDFASWSDGGAQSHNITVPSTPTTYTARFVPSSTLVGTSTVEPNVDYGPVGKAGAFRTTAQASGSMNAINVYVDSTSTGSSLVAGLYADAGGRPGTLMSSGRLDTVQNGAWNRVAVPAASVTGGTTYWITYLQPAGSSGILRIRDRIGGGWEETSSQTNLSGLPQSWSTGSTYPDGPISAYGSGGGAPPPPPALSVSPSSLSFSATAGGSNPASKALTVSNTGGGTLSFTASDNASWLSVSPASGTAPRDVSVSVDTAGLAAGTYNATVTVDAGGAQGSPKSIPVTLTVDPAPTGGLVGAWGFEESSGNTVNDVSGRANNGTITGAGRTTSGKNGRALSFTSSGQWVTVADSSSLDLTTGMTLEAWVYPTALSTVFRTVMLKERTGDYVYGLYANEDVTRPGGWAMVSSLQGATGPAALPLNAWSHLTTTYDGARLRLYVDGNEVASAGVTGQIATSSGPLRFGGNSIWPEWYRGRLDDMRVYSRALSPSEVQADMNRGVTATTP